MAQDQMYRHCYESAVDCLKFPLKLINNSCIYKPITHSLTHSLILFAPWVEHNFFLRGLVMLLASFRLSPGAVIVASPQWRKLLSGMSQVALVRSRIAFVTEVVSVASWFLWERVAGPLPNLILQIRKLPDKPSQSGYANLVRCVWFETPMKQWTQGFPR